MSRVGGREGEAFVSPSEQSQRIADACDSAGLKLIQTFEELDVSGGAALEHRPGLTAALELVETDRADVFVVAYFDRLVRSVQRQAEILDRVERAGGAILAVDVAEVRADTASHWLSSTMLGAVAEYHRRVTAERTQDAKRRAVARGVAPFAKIPPGLRRAADGSLEVDRKQASIVATAFKKRAGGATIVEVRDYLRKHGIERSFHGVQAMLTSRIYLGELRFGDLVNEHAVESIVDAVTFQRVQRMRVLRGRRPKSERLLARLGVLRCGTCGARLVVGNSRTDYPFYRCNPTSDCKRRVTISADLVEDAVVDEVKLLLTNVRGSASVSAGISEAEHAVARWEQELEAAVRAFSGLDDVEAARERLTELREARDQARGHLDDLRKAAGSALTMTAADDWDKLSREERRALVRAVIERVDVAPGRGDERITIHSRQQ